MADNEAPEAGVEGQEGQAPSAPEVSEVSQSEVSAQDTVTPDQLKEALSEIREASASLNEQMRITQGSVDKNQSRIEKELTELRQIRSRVEANDGNWDAVEREAVENETLTRLETLEKRLLRSDADDAWTDEWDTGISDIQDDTGVQFTAEELETLRTSKFSSKARAFAAVQKAADAKAAGESITTAVVAPEGASETPVATDVDGLEARVQSLKKSGAPLAERKKALQELQAAIS